MDVLRTKECFDNGERKFNEYLGLFGGKDELSERVDDMFNSLTEEDPEIMAFLFKQTIPIINSQNARDRSHTQKTIEIIKSFLILIDSMVYTGYIKEDFLPEKLKNKRTRGPVTLMEIPTEIYNDILKKTKKNLKKKPKK
jgi:hypothetical protein